MGERTFSRVPAETAAEVCRRYQPGRVAAALLRDDMTPGQFFDLLVERRLFEHARIFLAYALPSREAVWWAILCTREVAGPATPEREEAALRAAEAWVQDPSEENRRAARASAKAAGSSSPAGQAASAAFQSGGSVGPPDDPEMLPREYATARAVAFAVTFAWSQDPRDQAPERFQSFLARGVEVATGANRWTEPVKTDPQLVEATDGSEPQAASDDDSAQADLATPSKRAGRWRWQGVEATDGTAPRAATNGDSARCDPVTPSKRAARLRWD
jgi:hypothetical protein